MRFMPRFSKKRIFLLLMDLFCFYFLLCIFKYTLNRLTRFNIVFLRKYWCVYYNVTKFYKILYKYTLQFVMCLVTKMYLLIYFKVILASGVSKHLPLVTVIFMTDHVHLVHYVHPQSLLLPHA